MVRCDVVRCGVGCCGAVALGMYGVAGVGGRWCPCGVGPAGPARVAAAAATVTDRVSQQRTGLHCRNPITATSCATVSTLRHGTSTIARALAPALFLCPAPVLLRVPPQLHLRPPEHPHSTRTQTTAPLPHHRPAPTPLPTPLAPPTHPPFPAPAHPNCAPSPSVHFGLSRYSQPPSPPLLLAWYLQPPFPTHTPPVPLLPG